MISSDLLLDLLGPSGSFLGSPTIEPDRTFCDLPRTSRTQISRLARSDAKVGDGESAFCIWRASQETLVTYVPPMLASALRAVSLPLRPLPRMYNASAINTPNRALAKCISS